MDMAVEQLFMVIFLIITLLLVIFNPNPDPLIWTELPIFPCIVIDLLILIYVDRLMLAFICRMSPFVELFISFCNESLLSM